MVVVGLVSVTVALLVIVCLCLVLIWLVRMASAVDVQLGRQPGALVTHHGPALGSLFPQVRTTATNHEEMSFPLQSPTLLLVLSPGCPSCGTLVPQLRLLRHERGLLRVALLPEADGVSTLDSSLKAAGFAVVRSGEMMERLNLTVTPYAVFISDQGVVLAKGIVNDLWSVEGLLGTGKAHYRLSASQ